MIHVKATKQVRPFGVVESYWKFYNERFTDISERAVQEHLMPAEEFLRVVNDTRITKYTAFSLGEIVGLSVMTSDLEAWPLVSPAYFRRAYPGRTVFYIGFVAAAPGYLGVFDMLVRAMREEVVAAKGVFVMDFCSANIEGRRIPQVTERLLRSVDPDLTFGEIDRQVYYAGEFSG
jgi:hypothetical protein